MSAPRGDQNPMRLHKGLLSGEKNGSAKLTRSQVLEIRAKYADGATQVRLGKEYGVRQCHVSRIVRNESW